ncbi:MAG: imidazolonepropionase-like amidohydrolase [Paraglaciecola sp.]|jgi:imidazolonepropionase-like amidohydrolase
MKKLIILISSCLLCAAVQGQNYAIVGATVHTMSQQGSVSNATILIKDGKIQKVMAGEAALSDYQVIDAKGKVVTPGLIGAQTSLGLVEIGFSGGTVDSNAKVTPISASGAAMDISYGINPDSTLIAISRIEGVTSAATSMSKNGQLFNGQGALISLADSTSLLLKSAAFMSTNVSDSGVDTIGGSRGVLWVTLEQAIVEVEFAQDKTLSPMVEWHGDLTKADIRALLPVIKGDIPLLIDAKRAADIRQVLAFKKRHPKLDIVLLNATEGWRVADELAENNIAVILNPESNLPYAFDQLGATLENASRLHKAGVTVVIGMDTHNIRLAKQHAGNAVANGLPWLQGLAALTINPAKVYGIDQQLGSLEPGKQADLVIWSGDPLEVTESAEQVFINGEKIDMHSRQTKLRDRYLNLQQQKPMQYIRP